MKKIFVITFLLLVGIVSKSQSWENSSEHKQNVDELSLSQELHKENNGRINFFVFTKEKSNKIDWMSIYTLTRARMKSFFHYKEFRVIRAHSAGNAAMKIEKILKNKKKLIKDIWFDSHGHYSNRYSSFRIGIDQFNYKNIHDSAAVKHLQKIALYCDEQTKVGLGSCYAGADFYFPATDSTPVCRMNGDSLMIGMGKIFQKSSIYASESWVMAKPGIFKNRFGFAGYPLNKRFKDSVYAPVWERIGKWKRYSMLTGEIMNIATVALDKSGNIHIRTRHYNELTKAKKRIGIALKSLKPGIASFN